MLQDTSWLDVYLSDIPHIVYQVDEANNTIGAQHATLVNKGREAMGYLQVKYCEHVKYLSCEGSGQHQAAS